MTSLDIAIIRAGRCPVRECPYGQVGHPRCADCGIGAGPGHVDEVLSPDGYCSGCDGQPHASGRHIRQKESVERHQTVMEVWTETRNIQEAARRAGVAVTTAMNVVNWNTPDKRFKIGVHDGKDHGPKLQRCALCGAERTRARRGRAWRAWMKDGERARHCHGRDARGGGNVGEEE